MLFKKFINDERMNSLCQKAESEAFKLAVFLILISSVIKTNLFGYTTEVAYFDLGVIMILSIYVNFRWIRSGVRVIRRKSDETTKRSYIRTVIGHYAAVWAAVVILGLVGYFALDMSISDILKSIWPIAFILPLLVSGVTILFDHLSRRKNEKEIKD